MYCLITYWVQFNDNNDLNFIEQFFLAGIKHDPNTKEDMFIKCAILWRILYLYYSVM